MREEILALVNYRLQEARDSREEAEILVERGKLRGGIEQGVLFHVLRRTCFTRSKTNFCF